MATSQTAQFGPVLTTEELYTKEVYELPCLSKEDERLLVERARLGDKQAANELVCGVLRSVMPLARRYAKITCYTDFLDFCQLASLAMLEALPNALNKKVPGSYLHGVARTAMFEYHGLRDHLISKKSWDDVEKESYACQSIDASFDQDHENNLQDVLPAPDMVLGGHVEKDYAPVHTALQQLSEKQRTALIKGFGLCGSPCFPASEIEQELAGGVLKARSYAKKGSTPLYSQHRFHGIRQLKKRLERAGYACA